MIIEFDEINQYVNDNLEKGGGVHIEELRELRERSFYCAFIHFMSIDKTVPVKIYYSELSQLAYVYNIVLNGYGSCLHLIEEYISDLVEYALDEKNKPEKLSYLENFSKLEKEFGGFVNLLRVEIFTVDANTPALSLELQYSREVIRNGNGEFKVHLGNEGVMYFVSKYFGITDDVIEDVYLKDGDIKVACSIKNCSLVVEEMNNFQEYVEDCITGLL